MNRLLVFALVVCAPLLLPGHARAQQTAGHSSKSLVTKPRKSAHPQTFSAPNLSIADLAPQPADPQCPAETVLANAGATMQELVDVLADLTATETMLHQKLNTVGKVHGQQVRKSDFVLTIHRIPPAPPYVEEYRRDLEGGAFSDGISASGLLTLAFIFRPDMQSSYEMQCEGMGSWRDQPAWKVHFRQRADRPKRQLVYRVQGKVHNVSLQGRAWIEADGYHILHIEAEMMEAIPEIGLSSHFETADYGPVAFPRKNVRLWLPEETDMYTVVRGKRFRIAAIYTNYLLFQVEVTHSETPRGDLR